MQNAEFLFHYFSISSFCKQATHVMCFNNSILRLHEKQHRAGIKHPQETVKNQWIWNNWHGTKTKGTFFLRLKKKCLICSYFLCSSNLQEQERHKYRNFPRAFAFRMFNFEMLAIKCEKLNKNVHQILFCASICMFMRTINVT